MQRIKGYGGHNNKQYMKKAWIIVFFCTLGTGCAKIPPNKININLNALSFKWQYIFSSRCPYNPASLAPCVSFSSLDRAYWQPDSSYLTFDSSGNVHRVLQGINGAQVFNDSFRVVQVNDSLLRISSNKLPPTSIKIRTLQDHLLVLEYIADSYGNSFGLDSLIK